MLNNLSYLTIYCVPCEPKEEFTEATQSLNVQATSICGYVLNINICSSKENLQQCYRGKILNLKGNFMVLVLQVLAG